MINEVMDKDTLRLRLKLVLQQLEAMHTEILIMAAEDGIDPVKMRTTTGELLLAPIFISQAHALSALTALQD